MSLDVFLSVLVLAAGLAVIGTSLRRRPLGGLVRASILFVCLASAITAGATWKNSFRSLAPTSPEELFENRPVAIETDGYVSSDTCRACHPHHYDTWHASHHRTMTQVPSTDSVIADFDDAIVHHFGRDFRFYREGDAFFMEMKTPGSSTGEPPKSERKRSHGAHSKKTWVMA